jgi:hypothetical protein
MGLQKRVNWLFGLIIFTNLVIVLVVVLGAFGPPPPRPLPNPNGYDDFTAAGKLVSSIVGDWTTNTEPQLVAIVATNAEALKLARVGLGRECCVPGVSNAFSTNSWDIYVDRHADQKKLAINFWREGRLAEMQKRTNDAVQSFLDAEHFGVECCRGGMILSKSVGIACESLGRSGLRPLADDLDAQQSRKIAQTLASFEAHEDSLNDCLEQERDFSRRTSTIAQKIAGLIMYKQRQAAVAKFTAKYQKNQRERRILAIDSAARAYTLEKGKPPGSVHDLVPDYLKAVPQDPATGAELGLRASGY